LTVAFLSDPSLQGLAFDAASAALAKTQLQAQGLPQVEKDILSQLGFSQDDTQAAGAITAGLMDYIPLQWQTALTSGVDALSTLTDQVGSWADERMRQLSPGNAPPVLNPISDRRAD